MLEKAFDSSPGQRRHPFFAQSTLLEKAASSFPRPLLHPEETGSFFCMLPQRKSRMLQEAKRKLGDSSILREEARCLRRHLILLQRRGGTPPSPKARCLERQLLLLCQGPSFTQRHLCKKKSISRGMLFQEPSSGCGFCLGTPEEDADPSQLTEKSFIVYRFFAINGKNLT